MSEDLADDTTEGQKHPLAICICRNVLNLGESCIIFSLFIFPEICTTSHNNVQY